MSKVQRQGTAPRPCRLQMGQNPTETPGGAVIRATNAACIQAQRANPNRPTAKEAGAARGYCGDAKARAASEGGNPKRTGMWQAGTGAFFFIIFPHLYSSPPLRKVLRLLARSGSSTLTAGASQTPQTQNPLAQQQCQALGQLSSPPLGDDQLVFVPSTLARDGS